MAFNWRAVANLPINAGSGQIPTKRLFRRSGPAPIWTGASVHDNPRFFKHRWRIWTIDEALPDDWRVVGIDWRNTVPELCFADAITKMRDLFICREFFLVASSACKRDDPAAPWDIDLVRRNGRFRVAPALADDPDPEFFGHR